MKPKPMVKDNNVIRIKGELTFDTVMSLWKANDALVADAKVVDLSEVTRADSAGVALLCEFKRRQHDLAFQHTPEKLENIIKLSGLSAFLLG
ncbi:MAG: hypothetical protein CMF39_05580 [Legionellaceae bacterium]|nr:hypothetical protein [Legionellaceae bacterium]